jgi:hypothetical protein
MFVEMALAAAMYGTPGPSAVQSFNDGFTTAKQDDCQLGFLPACEWLARVQPPEFPEMNPLLHPGNPAALPLSEHGAMIKRNHVLPRAQR